ncbi:helix-turn-helix transcriptional regulator [Bacillus sp. EB600]|uniref:helix-turn-helix domain-containing protein n=1 Tax=Bacillus sp. EB600 TaxID=2806345 RepID=UPI00210B39C9|nr:helix-turn-helix transcriptional regulator [Bacillus sp. EB600]MCQ6281809.1 helix-turn-helix transcriptional regulator [Bacillus sp. EB600]
MNVDNKHNNFSDKQKIVYLSSGNRESLESQDESEGYSYISVRFKKENFEKLLSYTNYANVEAKIRKIDVEYTPEDFIKGATMYFINAMLDDIEPNNPEIIKKLYETLPEFVPILIEATKQLEDSPKQDIEQLIKCDGAIKNNIKQLMKDRKMTQKELSELTGIDKSNLSIYMNNKSQPSIEFFLRIWHALEYPPLTELLYKEK